MQFSGCGVICVAIIGDIIMKRRIITKISVICAALCGVLCGLSVMPLLVAVGLTLFALVCIVVCAAILLTGVFVWIFSGTQISIFDFGVKIAEFGAKAFEYVLPITRFSFDYFTPFAGWIAFGVGVAGIAVSSAAIATSKSLPQEAEPIQEEFLSSVTKPKKNKRKMKDKSVCIATLITCIVFTAAALVAVVIAAKITV